MSITLISIAVAIGFAVGYGLRMMQERKSRYIGQTINTAFAIKQEKKT